MLVEGLRLNRSEAARNVAAEFISGEPNDDIRLTISADESSTQCPITTDHASLLNLLQNVRTDIAVCGLISDGMIVGMGLVNAVSCLRDSKVKSKVVTLIIDGSNNMGDTSPMIGIQIAQSLGVRVYTIGVGTNKVAPCPINVGGTAQYMNIPVEIDSKTLNGITTVTEGNFHRATNNKELKQIYDDIDKLEETKMEVKRFFKRYEAFQPLVLAAIASLLLELLLRDTILRRTL